MEPGCAKRGQGSDKTLHLAGRLCRHPNLYASIDLIGNENIHGFIIDAN